MKGTLNDKDTLSDALTQISIEDFGLTEDCRSSASSECTSFETTTIAMSTSGETAGEESLPTKISTMMPKRLTCVSQRVIQSSCSVSKSQMMVPSPDNLSLTKHVDQQEAAQNPAGV